jgi:Tfp pilus assembly protein PilV
MRLEFLNKKVNKKNKTTKSFQQSSRQTGFMMIEAVLSIFILGTILIVFVQIISKTYSEKNDKINILIATSLAQEGIEVVRNVRDTNWKSDRDGFDSSNWPVSGNQNAYVEYSINYDVSPALKSHPPSNLLRIRSADNFYTHATWGATGTLTASKFSRTVNIGAKNASTGSVSVTSTVTWNSGAKNVSITDTLYEWGNK